MDPYGKFIQDYKIFSYKEHDTFQFQAECTGFPNIRVVTELERQCQFVMTRSAFLGHLNKSNHYNTVEEYLEVLNNPDLILLNQRTEMGNKVQFFTKTREDKISIVIVYTYRMRGLHAIATGYDITPEVYEKYQERYTEIWRSEE